MIRGYDSGVVLREDIIGGGNMAEIKIEEIVDHLSTKMRSALDAATRSYRWYQY